MEWSIASGFAAYVPTEKTCRSLSIACLSAEQLRACTNAGPPSCSSRQMSLAILLWPYSWLSAQITLMLTFSPLPGANFLYQLRRIVSTAILGKPAGVFRDEAIGKETLEWCVSAPHRRV